MIIGITHPFQMTKRIQTQLLFFKLPYDHCPLVSSLISLFFPPDLEIIFSDPINYIRREIRTGKGSSVLHGSSFPGKCSRGAQSMLSGIFREQMILKDSIYFPLAKCIHMKRCQI